MVQHLQTKRPLIAHLLLTIMIIGQCGNLLHAEDIPQKTSPKINTYRKLAKLHAPILGQELAKERKKQQDLFDKYARLSKYRKIITSLPSPLPGDAARLSTAFELFASHLDNLHIEDPQPSLDNTTIHDLQLFSGPSHNPNMNIIAYCDRTRTSFGFVELSHLFIKPSVPLEKLQARQDAIKFLVDNPYLLQHLDEKLAELAQAEEQLFAFYDAAQPALKKYEDSVATTLQRLVGAKNPFAHLYVYLTSTPIRHAVGTTLLSLLANECCDPQDAIGFDMLLASFMSITHPIATFLTPATWNVLDYLTNGSSTDHLPDILQGLVPDQERLNFSNFYSHTIPTIQQQCADKWDNWSGEEQTLAVVMGSIGTVVTAALLSSKIQEEYKTISSWNELFNFAGGVVTIVNVARNLGMVVAQNEQLLSAVPSWRSMFNVASGSEPGAQTMVNYINPIPVIPSKIASVAQAMTICSMMFDEKANLINVMKQIGKIDALVSAAKLYVEQATYGNVPYCFAHFVKADKPHLALDRFWHPFSGQDTISLNSIKLGGDSMANNALLNGPHASAKAGILKDVAWSVIMAQTLTYAPAYAMQLTPFASIHSYIDTTDFKSLHALKDLKPDQFSFMIMDKLFINADPAEGEVAAFNLVTEVSTLTNNIALMATHFNKLTTLEDMPGSMVKNYHIVAENLPNQTTKPVYHLQQTSPGQQPDPLFSFATTEDTAEIAVNDDVADELMQDNLEQKEQHESVAQEITKPEAAMLEELDPSLDPLAA